MNREAFINELRKHLMEGFSLQYHGIMKLC